MTTVPTRAAPAARIVAAALAVAALVAVVYAPARTFQFVNYDDPRYVRFEPHVRAGLTRDTVTWAFGRSVDNWHPLTSLSHAAVWQLWGDTPAAHHLVNVALHATNAALVVLALASLTGDVARAAIVALLFALHPLRIESVAWVTERKDVLSGLGFLLTVWAYGAWVRRPSPRRWHAVVAAFVVALLAKPMVVTLPIALLVLDWWPLARAERWPALVREKALLFALAAVTSVATVVAQWTGGSVSTLRRVPIGPRLANAVVGNARYLGLTAWPARLAYFYPYHPWPARDVVAATLLLITVTAAACAVRRRHPYVLAGWVWWLVMLAPVAGIIQVGEQSIADRYTYLPSIGLVIAIVWLIADLARPGTARVAAAGAGAAALVALAVATSRHLPAWRDSETIARAAIAAVPGNYMGHLNLGQELAARGDYVEAQREYEAAYRIKPDSPPVLVNLGYAALRNGATDDADAWFRRALAAHPGYAKAVHGLGRVTAARGDVAGALTAYDRALALDPSMLDARADLADALAQTGRIDDAVREYEAVAAVQATYGFELGNLRFRQNDAAGAIEAWRRALAVEPAWADARDNVAVGLLALGRADEAVPELRRVLDAEPGHFRARLHLGYALATLGRRTEAIEALRAARALRPDDAAAAKALADLEPAS